MGSTLFCPVCRSTEIKTISTIISKCKDCSLQFVTRSETEPFYNALYDESYFNGRVYRNYLEEENYRRNLFRDKIKILKNYIPTSGTVLDIGCGMGFFLKEMLLSGYSVHGNDISSYAVEIASKKLSVNIQLGNLREQSFLKNYFDIVTLWDLLEHIPDPVESLKEVSRIIKNNGVLVIETLNISSFTARILKEKWPLYYPPYHIYYYNYRSISRLLENTGFRLVKIFPVQTYIKSSSGYRALRYFRYPLIRELAGILFDDVVIYIARPT